MLSSMVAESVRTSISSAVGPAGIGGSTRANDRGPPWSRRTRCLAVESRSFIGEREQQLPGGHPDPDHAGALAQLGHQQPRHHLHRGPLVQGGGQRIEQGRARRGQAPAEHHQLRGQHRLGDRSPSASAATASAHTARASASVGSTASTSAAPATGRPVRSVYATAIARAEANVSRQPRAPQPQRGPVGRIRMCPISPACPAPPATSAPPASTAPAMPVPITTNSASRAPRPAPRRSSAEPAAATSCRTATGSPSAAPRWAATGAFRQPRLALSRPIPRSASTIPGTPTPTARTGPTGVAASSSRASSATTSRTTRPSPPCCAGGVGRRPASSGRTRRPGSRP